MTRPSGLTARSFLLASILLLAIPGAAERERRWEVLYDVHIVPTEGVAHVEILLEGYASLVELMRFRVDPDRHSGFAGDGEISVSDDGVYVTWLPPETGGSLRYDFRIDHLRDRARYDARVTTKWALFRGDDLVPPARVDTVDDAPSESRLQFRLPKGWRVVTAYTRRSDDVFVIDHPHRLFDRPTGWMAAGRLGTLREKVAGTRLAVSGPTGQGLRRHDLLALLRWTLPTLRNVFGELPERLLVLSAGDPMWRGGLSGPNSLFIHADRPLISSDLTSPLLHEVIHTIMSARSGSDGDWIVEGLAEYYALQALVRSRTVSQRRYEKALAKVRARGQSAKTLTVEHAHGDVTARAVGVLADLDREIRDRTGDKASLDDVVARLAQLRGPVTIKRFRAIVEKIGGGDFDAFFRRHVS
jgi:predicted metalloprotease with PDZ domain